MATWMGIEPMTSSVTGWHSNQLNYQAAFYLPLFIYYYFYSLLPLHFFLGGRNRARTYDPLLVRQVLSQLSYAPFCFFGDPTGIRTRVTAVKGRCLNRLTIGPLTY